MLLEDKTMLSEYIENNYKAGEPIFEADVQIEGMSDNNLRQSFKVLCDSGKIKRYDKGIYYIPKESRLKGNQTLSASRVISSRYITRHGQISGYYSGYVFANQIGLTSQVPFSIEIVTNYASRNYREVEYSGQKVILRKPKAEVTDRNWKILQLLDLLKDADKYADTETAGVAGRVRKYVRDNDISKADVDELIQLYPDRIYRIIYEMELYDVFT